MRFEEALVYVAKYLSKKTDEVSPQMIFYLCRGEIELVQIHTSLRILVENQLADVRYGDNRFYKLNKTGRTRLKLLESGKITHLLESAN